MHPRYNWFLFRSTCTMKSMRYSVLFTLKIMHIFISLVCPVDASLAEELLTIKMMRHSHLLVRPSGCPTACEEPVYVNLTYNVIQIMAFTQAEETMKISGWFTMQWYDYRLRWNTSEFDGVTQIDFVSDELWRPDVGLMNGKHSHYFDFSADRHSRINIDYEGRITWLYGAVLDVACPLDFADFPFDTQVCHLIITPWQSSMRQLKLLPMQHGPAVDNYFLPNSNVSEWEIQSIKFALEHYRSQFGVSYQYINISIQLRRQPLYFIILVLVPFSMLSILACLIFTLDDTGDRLSVALSLILSMTMYVVIVSSNAPRSMRTVPILGIFLLDQLGLLCIATVIAVLSNKLHQFKGEWLDAMNVFLEDLTTVNNRMVRQEHYNAHAKCSSDASTGSPPVAAGTPQIHSSATTDSPSPVNRRRSITHMNYNRTCDNYATACNSYSSPQVTTEFPEQLANEISFDYSARGVRLANSQQQSPIYLAQDAPFSMQRKRSTRLFNVYPQPTMMKQHRLNVSVRIHNDNPFRKVYKLFRKLFHPDSFELRRNVAAVIDNLGILVYLVATFMNAVFCLLIMPGRER